MEETFFSALGSCKNPPRKRKNPKKGSLRPEFRFRFRDSWTFSRESVPNLSAARDFSDLPFNVDLSALAQQAGKPLSALETDLAWVAIAVYLADRTSPRRPYGISGPVFWRRQIHVVVPVNSPNLWEKARTSLTRALEFLTEDDWTFEFIGGRRAFMPERQEYFRGLRNTHIEWTSLFSGGLDSLAGALHWLQSSEGNGLLVSGQTHNRIISGQEAQVADLREYFTQRVEHVGVKYGLPDKSGVSGLESSQRTRAFIHTAFGSLAALLADNNRLYLFENGFGALNLPCDSAQFGSQNSRGTHPVFLGRMAAFISSLFDCPFEITNPFGNSTKAQMLSLPGMGQFGDLLHKSFSCDRFPNYPHKAPQCGTCASCLIRRVAFHGSGVPDDSESYMQDLLNPRRLLRERELLALTKLSIQADTLDHALHQPSPWLALCANWPDLLRTEWELDSSKFQPESLKVLSRHVDEWRDFCSPIQWSSLTLAA